MKKVIGLLLVVALLLSLSACNNGKNAQDTNSSITQDQTDVIDTSSADQSTSDGESESTEASASNEATDSTAANTSDETSKSDETNKTTKTTKKRFTITDAIRDAFASVGAQINKGNSDRTTSNTTKGTTRPTVQSHTVTSNASSSVEGPLTDRPNGGNNSSGGTLSTNKQPETGKSNVTGNTSQPVTGNEELIKLSVSYSLGSINEKTGKDVADSTRLRTDLMPLKEIYLKAGKDCRYAVFCYNKDKQYLGHTSFTAQEKALTDCAVKNTAFFRLVIGDVSGASLAAYVDTYGEQMGVYAIKPNTGATDSKQTLLDLIKELFYPEYVSDVPENAGVRNALLNMKQLEQIKYTPLKDIPQQKGDFEAGVEHTGIPYSSTRPEALFAPANVSLHTFMTAVQNPNSYLYTVDLGESGNVNGHTYYGTVCSTACGYALGIAPNYSTHQWAEIPGMKVIDNQSAGGLKLADTVVGKGHVVMITGITRTKRGKIGTITTTEAAGSGVFSLDYTPAAFERKYPPSDYQYCRYTKVNTVKHEASPYVAVGDEKPQTVTYNTAIIPRKGDKANWLKGQDVVIDVLKPGKYTRVEIYKDGKLHTTKAIESVITLSDLAAGSYKARLTDGTNASDWCYWIVVDATSSAVARGSDGKVTVTFSATNATPRWVQWADGKHNGTLHITELTARQAADGVAECSYAAGSYKIRVAFETEYGIIHSELPKAIKVK